jgi:tetratricopeptide (TPR) repeat protein
MERKGELESAEGDYDKVIELNPQSAGAYAGRGILRLSQKKDAEAQADFDQCLKLNPAMKDSLNRRIEYAKYQRDKKNDD